uniref:Uncharacterized protein n=1 Tax=Arundo donax TaxID=35708 RepID=A0A0A9PVY3_ARUDO
MQRGSRCSSSRRSTRRYSSGTSCLLGRREMLWTHS